MDSEILSRIKKMLKDPLKDKKVIDIILFGSVAKGSVLANDFDIAIISGSEIKINQPGFHVALIKPEDFVEKPSMLINTLLREGYSLKNNKPFSEIYGFSQRILFNYNLLGLDPSTKVKIVNSLRGTKKQKGLVELNKGVWIANQVFTIPVSNEKIFEKFFINLKIDYKKSYILMH